MASVICGALRGAKTWPSAAQAPTHLLRTGALGVTGARLPPVATAADVLDEPMLTLPHG